MYLQAETARRFTVIDTAPIGHGHCLSVSASPVRGTNMKVYSQPLQPNNTFNDTFVACCLSPSYYNRYVHGEYNPHYPMPAIRLSVTIDANFTCIFDTTNKTCVLAVEQPGYVPFGDGLY